MEPMNSFCYIELLHQIYKEKPSIKKYTITKKWKGHIETLGVVVYIKYYYSPLDKQFQTHTTINYF